jgi:K+-transporting ATPase ATPase C chain
MKKQITTAILYTAVTALMLGIVYPLAVTGIAHLLFPRQAAGSLITQNGRLVGSSLIGQTFSGPGYFHSRPSAAGAGYDAGASSGSNLGPTSKAFIDRTQASVASEQTGKAPVPVDLVSAVSGSAHRAAAPPLRVYGQQSGAAAHHPAAARPARRTPRQRP